MSTSSDASGERVAPSYTPSLNDQPESTHSGPTPYRPESSGDGGDGGSGGGGGSGGSGTGGGSRSDGSDGSLRCSGGGSGGGGVSGGVGVSGEVGVSGRVGVSGGASVCSRSSVSWGGIEQRHGSSCYGGSSGGNSGGASSYGTNSEMGDFAHEFEWEQQLRPNVACMMALVERPSSSARRRETVLWKTLEDIGITPHDERSYRDTASPHVSSEHPHVE